ncbi:MAG: NAD(P)/FAD-dependent oxidoreductase [Candidatus Methanospirareceae archaeon]
MSVINCDVLVVGAGPAGSVAALYCSRHGLKTILIEKTRGIGQHMRPRIDSSPEAGLTKILKELDLKTENRVFTSTWYSPSGSSFTLHSKKGEYYFKRGPDPDSFECSTVRKAIKFGCMLLDGVKVKNLHEAGERFDQVTLLRDNEVIVITPKLLIAADGGHSLFHAYLNKTLISTRVAFGVTGKDFGHPDTSEISFDASLAPGGYFYIVTSPGGLSSAGIVVDSLKMQRSAHSYFNSFLTRNPKIAQRLTSILNNYEGSGEIFDLAAYRTKNCLFVGDAAGLIDPLFGYGMMPAIVSAYYASKYSRDAIKTDDFQILQDYDTFIRHQFPKRVSHLYRKVFDTLDNGEFELIIDLLNELQSKTDIDKLLCLVDS